MTCSVKSLTTLKLTSASRRAARTSRIDSRMFSSEMRPRPDSDRNTPENFSVNASNMPVSYPGDRDASGVCQTELCGKLRADGRAEGARVVALGRQGDGAASHLVFR